MQSLLKPLANPGWFAIERKASSMAQGECRMNGFGSRFSCLPRLVAACLVLLMAGMHIAKAAQVSARSRSGSVGGPKPRMAAVITPSPPASTRTWRQTLSLLRLPAARPYFLAMYAVLGAFEGWAAAI
jgi:hypothetical protein